MTGSGDRSREQRSVKQCLRTGGPLLNYREHSGRLSQYVGRPHKPWARREYERGMLIRLQTCQKPLVLMSEAYANVALLTGA